MNALRRIADLSAGAVAALVLIATFAYADPFRGTWVREQRGDNATTGQTTCTTSSSAPAAWAANGDRMSMTFRNIGANDVYICAAATCTTAAGLPLFTATKDAVTFDQAVRDVAWSCISVTGSTTVAYQDERW